MRCTDARDMMHTRTGCDAHLAGFGAVYNGIRSIMSRGAMHNGVKLCAIYCGHYKVLPTRLQSANLLLISSNHKKAIRLRMCIESRQD